MPSMEELVSGAVAEAREEGALPPESDVDVVDDAAEEGADDTNTQDDGISDGSDKKVTVGADEGGTEKPKAEGDKVKGGEKPEGSEKPAKKVPEQSALDKELGLKPGQRRDNPIPYSRVARISDNFYRRGRQEVREAVATSLGFKPEDLADEKLADTLKAHGTEVTGLRDYKQRMDDIQPIMLQDPGRFMLALTQLNPAYQQYIDAFEGRGKTTTQDDDKTKKPVDADEPLPDADLNFQLADGTKVSSYSKEAFNKAIEIATKKLERQFSEVIDKRVKPFETEAERAEAETKLRGQIAGAVAAVLEEAREWEGFKENEDAIIKSAVEDFKGMPTGRAVRAAYQKIVIQPLKQKGSMTLAQMREQVLAEQKAAAEGTSVSTTTPVDRDDDDVERDAGGAPVGGMEAIVKKAWREAKARR